MKYKFQDPDEVDQTTPLKVKEVALRACNIEDFKGEEDDFKERQEYAPHSTLCPDDWSNLLL